MRFQKLPGECPTAVDEARAVRLSLVELGFGFCRAGSYSFGWVGSTTRIAHTPCQNAQTQAYALTSINPGLLPGL